MKQEIFDLSGKARSATIDLDESVWGIEPHIAVMHQALVMQLANARVGTATPRPAPKCAVVDANHGDKKAPAAPDRVRSGRRTGRAAVWFSGHIRVITLNGCRSGCAAWQCARLFPLNCETAGSRLSAI